MFLEIEGLPYTLHFNHTKDKREHWMTKCVFHPGKCTIKGHADSFREEDKPLLYGCALLYGRVGVAHCNPSDQFRKTRGRVIALERALEGLSRAERSKVWNAYFKIAQRP